MSKEIAPTIWSSTVYTGDDMLFGMLQGSTKHNVNADNTQPVCDTLATHFERVRPNNTRDWTEITEKYNRYRIKYITHIWQWKPFSLATSTSSAAYEIKVLWKPAPYQVFTTKTNYYDLYDRRGGAETLMRQHNGWHMFKLRPGETKIIKTVPRLAATTPRHTGQDQQYLKVNKVAFPTTFNVGDDGNAACYDLCWKCEGQLVVANGTGGSGKGVHGGSIWWNPAADPKTTAPDTNNHLLYHRYMTIRATFEKPYE